MGGTSKRPASEPKQARSRATRDRICEAMQKLLEEKPYHAISVEELALRSGVSNSSLYSRFSSKLAVLDFLHARAVDDAARGLAGLEREPEPGQTVAEFAESLVMNYLAYRRKHWAVLRAARDLERDDAKIRSRRALHDKRGFTKIRAALLARAGGEGSTISAEQVDRSIVMVAGAIRAIVDDPGHGAHSTSEWQEQAQREAEVARFVRSALHALLVGEGDDTSVEDAQAGQANA